MTTTVTINAHLSSSKEVKVRVTNAGEVAEEFTLQDGESAYRVVYDDLVIKVEEVEKSEAEEAEEATATEAEATA